MYSVPPLSILASFYCHTCLGIKCATSSPQSHQMAFGTEAKSSRLWAALYAGSKSTSGTQSQVRVTPGNITYLPMSKKKQQLNFQDI